MFVIQILENLLAVLREIIVFVVLHCVKYNYTQNDNDYTKNQSIKFDD